MGALLSLPHTLLNFLLPFTDKSTPLVQDLVHTAILCGTLYFAPQLVELYKARRNPDSTPYDIPDTAPDIPVDDIPIDENFVLQPDEDEDIEPPPLAPTPPPEQDQGPGFREDVDAGAAHWQDQGAAHFAGEELQAQAGPANDRPRPTAANRVVGAKKAKSLARKDQRRAYHEFHRQEAELRRQREAEGKEEREAALAAEKARRAEAERLIQEREREERERKKEEERREQEEERLRRERVIGVVREELEKKGAVDLVDVAWEEGKDRVWIERLVRASGLLSQIEKDGAFAVITGAGWAVRIDKQLMRDAYANAVRYGNENKGKVSFDDFGGILENAVRARAEM